MALLTRRKLLAGGIAIGGYGGIQYVLDSTESDQVTTAAPTYEGDPIQRSGVGRGQTETFNITNSGGTVISATTTNQAKTSLSLENSMTGNISTLLITDDSVQIERMYALSTGDHKIYIQGDPGEWDISIFDYPLVTPDSEYPATPPVKTEGVSESVVGPLSLDKTFPTEFEIAFEAGGDHHVDAYDAKGNFRRKLFAKTPTDEAPRRQRSQVGGVGYLGVKPEGETQWELSVTTIGERSNA